MDQQLQQIHNASMKILQKTGMKFHHPKAIDTLKENGIKVEGNIAYFSEEQVMKWVKKAPGSFTMYARNPKNNVVVGGDHINHAPGFGAAKVVDLAGNQRKAVFDDYMQFLKLYQQSNNYKINGGVIVQPVDVSVDKSLAMMLYATLNLSDKCIVLISI